MNLAKRSVHEQHTDIILYTTPRNISELELVLNQSQGLKRCYAIFAESDEKAAVLCLPGYVQAHVCFS